MAIVKYCAPCGKEKPTSEFYKNKATKDGLERVCKKCSYARYNARAPKQRDNPNPNPFERACSRESKSVKFLETLLLVYGPDTYCIDQTVDKIAEHTNVPPVSVFRYLHTLLKLKLLTRRYHNLQDKSMGYDWYISMNKPH
jgi:hypothetical protein